MDSEPLEKKYENLREQYNPRKKGKKVRVLFIAESPPEPNSTGDLPYFYNKGSQQKKGALWRHFNEALYGGRIREKERFLSQFQDDGYFLIDVFQTKQELIDTRRYVEREQYKNAVKISKRLFDRILEIRPERVVLLGKGTASLLAGSLPFRSESNEKRFRRFIAASVAAEL